jgi:hypothetical protein
MRAIIFLCCVFATSLSAQSPSGVFTLLQTKPCVVEVTSVSSGAGGFKLALRADDGGESKYEYSSSSLTPEQQFVAQLKAHQRYAFPQCLIDFLGLDETVRLMRILSRTTPFFSTTPGVPSGLLDLGREHPFRATVLDPGLEERSCAMVLQGADSRLYLASGPYNGDVAKKIAEQLKRGETYEFPAALEDVLLSAEKRAAKARPQSPEIAVLGRYIGSWSGTLESDAAAKVRMNCHWLADGTGIWREMSFGHEGSEEAPTLDIARIVYDARKKAYISADPAADSSTALTSTWDEATRTFTTTLPTPASGQTRINTATFTTEARIDWKTVTQDASGQVTATKRGSYVRTAKKVPPVKLPAAAPKVALAPQSFSGSLSYVAQSSTTGSLATATVAPQQLMVTPAQVPPVIYTDLFKMRELPPFRGKVSHIEFNANSFTAKVERPDQRQVSIHHTRGEDWELALRIAKRLKLGTTHEFPAALAEEYEPPAEGFVAQPTTDAMRALSAFIGEWSMHWTTGPGRDRNDPITVHYFWSNDGTGLWREVHLPAGLRTGTAAEGKSKASVEASLTTYDAATQRYSENYSSAFKGDERQDAEWDAKTQTFSLVKNAAPSAGGAQYSGTRRIVSPERIEFHAKTTKADGSVLSESGGYYKRIGP